MFEGLVRQLILGYLGQYIKDIQQEQLRITLWNEEVLLENVELILEAFDYLQLPLALKHGRVGKLSIKIPWKKLGWDPIIIVLEDVFLSACQREDEEWSMDAVARRDFAGKKAKLAAAELAKLSRRVCDNRAGKSFVSYITAKILDGIQVSIRNVHVLYRDMLNASAVTVFGVKFSSLTISPQNLVGFSGGKVRGGQVNKLIEVQGLELYCNTFEGTLDLMNIESKVNLKHQASLRFEGNNNVHILVPLDVSVSLSVNRSGKLENDAPQYCINAELTSVDVSVDEVQLQQILILIDYLSTCPLRERYGRYRPWRSLLGKKLKGWQIAWWHYAQESVLSDVRERLKRTSWKYLGERLNCRRKYLNLYRTKLKCLQQDQATDEDVLRELEEMEKVTDIDDILSYRSAAERELQDVLINPSFNHGSIGTSADKSLEDERPYSKPRGWLNWLSHGMLGAGGTDDSREFSGVISDDVIKDIYEATMFHPVASMNEDAATIDKIFLSSMKFDIQQISATLRSKGLGSAVACWMLHGISFESKIWEGSAVIIAAISSSELFNPVNEQVILSSGKLLQINEENKVECQPPSISIQVDISPSSDEVCSSLKVLLQPIRIMCDSNSFVDIVKFFHIFGSFKFQHERVLLSVNEINDVQVRLLSKIDYLMSSRRRIKWDINFVNLVMIMPWMEGDSNEYEMVLNIGAFNFQSKDKRASFASDLHDLSYHHPRVPLSLSSTNGFARGFQIEDLYDHYEINVNDFEVKISRAYSSEFTPLIEKFNCSILLESCIISDESMLKALDVSITTSSVHIHFSPSIYGSILGLVSNFSKMHQRLNSGGLNAANVLNVQSNGLTSKVFWFSVRANMDYVRSEVDLENDVENGYCLMLSLQMLNVSFDMKEVLDCWTTLETLKIEASSKKNEAIYYNFCSSGDQLNAESSCQHEKDIKHRDQGENFDDKGSSADRCLQLHYEADRDLEITHHKFTVSLTNLDIHCYPFIVALLVGFFDKIVTYEMPILDKDSSILNIKSSFTRPSFDFHCFGFSNFVETGASEWANIPVDHFPFVSICNSGQFFTHENSLIYGIPHWRKILNLRVQKIKSRKFSFKKGSRCQYSQLGKSMLTPDPLPQNSSANKMVSAELNLSSSRIHFHDSSCVVGTLSFATCKSSLSACNDCFDILCSTEGLVLSSSWWCQTIDNFLWGPLSQDLSPIVNIRVRKELTGSMELSFSIQHVSCTLYPEFLAVMIGYFSSPDWSCNMKDQSITSDKSDCSNSEDSGSIFYKFEILDSILMTPGERDSCQFLKLDIQQLLCSFLENCDLNLVLMGIPHEWSILVDKLPNRNHFLNLFGRDLSLSLLLVKDDLFDSSSANEISGHQNVTLISPCSADVWVTFPIQSSIPSLYPTCIMGTIINCQLDAGGARTIDGFKALVDVIDQFSMVDRESKLFKYDVLEFLQSKRRLEEDDVLPHEDSAVTATEIRLSVRSMSIRLLCSKRESIVSELAAEFEMQFTCSASLVNNKPIDLDISLSYLTVFSFLNSVMLLEGTVSSPSSNSSSSFADMTLSVSDEGGNKLLASLPCLNVWMHMFDWNEVIVLCDYYYNQLSKQSVEALPKNVQTVETEASDTSDSSIQLLSMSSSSPSQNVKSEPISFALKLESVGVTTYIPVWFSGDVFSILEEPQVPNKKHLNDSCDAIYGNHPGFIALAWQSRCSEIIDDSKKVILKIKLESVGGIVQLYMNNILRTWSLFHLFHTNLEAEILNHQMELTHAKVAVYSDSLEMGLSNDIFALSQCMCFWAPEAGPSQQMFSSVDFKIQLGKFSLLLTDEKWSSCRPLIEILMRNLLLHCTITGNETDGSVEGDLQANYNNIDKVLWEPLVEPWNFQLSISRKNDFSSLLNGAIRTHIHLKSRSQLNLNLTESVIEVVSRAIEMIKTVQSVPEITVHSDSLELYDSQISENLKIGRYAPYILHNLTSLPLVFHVYKGEPSADDLNELPSKSGNFVQPGFYVPIYIDETPQKQPFHCRASQSSDRLFGMQIVEAAHRYIVIQLEGTSNPSIPISMDLVGHRFFEVDFSKPISKSIIGDTRDVLRGNTNVEGNSKTDEKNRFLIPVVIDVSVQRYTKLLRLYSTVIFSNATPVPLEVRFDIPFGVSPKILDPIYPGKEFPLPLHLAEAGRMRWRPLGDTYLWSEAYNVSNIVSYESRTTLLRSFVCYPSHPNSDPFRCCISVGDRYSPDADRVKNKFADNEAVKPSIKGSKTHGMETSKKRFIHHVTLACPLVLKNYLPEPVWVSIENGGVTRTELLSKVETPFFHIDCSHDLTITFTIERFRPAVLKFARAETFSTIAKFSGTKFSLSETLTFDSELADGPLCVTMEKVMDAFSGAREIYISVPFLIYNCIGFPIILSNSVNEIKGHNRTVPSCYDLDEHEQILGSKEGLSLLSFNQQFHKSPLDTVPTIGFLKNPSVTKSCDHKYHGKPLNPFDRSKIHHRYAEKLDSQAGRSSICPPKNESNSNSQSNLKSDMKSPDVASDCKKAEACMYCPTQSCSSSEIMVKLTRFVSDDVAKNIPSYLWSNPFSLVPPTGSISVTVPHLRMNAGCLVSVSAVAAPLSGRTKIITFQPRYVISNACRRDLYYKQKGTDHVFLLEAGRHTHIQCTDAARELLVCVHFREPGWQWSGCFSPEHLGDTQVKMRNFISGAVNMMRVEVQSADISIKDAKIVGSPHGNSGTNLILLSDDDTGFMPYRIDNFSKERLRIYQQRCENFETMVHSYTSHSYAWDEPCFPHRLTVEVPGERVIGSYTLDIVKDYSPVRLPATSEKPERTLLVSVHSEGAIKVLSIIDSSYHVLNDLQTLDAPHLKHNRKHAQKREVFLHYSERILIDIPFIGISLINNYPEELLFACAKNTRLDLVQSLDQQKLSLHVSFLQIDNQLASTPYPVLLSFDHGNKGFKDDRGKIASMMQIDSDGLHEPVFSLSMAKWRSKHLSLVSLEYINLRVADFHLELEQEVILRLVEFFKTVSLRFQSMALQHMHSTLDPPSSDPAFVMDISAYINAHEFVKSNGNQPYSSTISLFHEDCRKSSLLPSVTPIGAPWQQIHLLARKQKKIYVELLDLAPIRFTLSFSSSPWMLRNGVLTSGESLIHRGLMALADVEGAQIHLKELALSHQLASWESIQEILIRHYTRQSLHEMYKVFGSAGLIGNPMGFARSVSLGIREFLSAPVQSVFQSPVGLLTGMAQGTSSLLNNTVYAISDAATQFSRAAHKGIVAFTLDDQTVGLTEKQQKGKSSHSKGVINEFLEGLTGLLQSPIQGAEKHGLPGVLSGIALGVTGLVAKPAASILEVTGKTAQSIRNRSKLSHSGSQRLRVRLPRPLSRGFPLKPYSWEEAIGTSVLRDAESGVKLRDEISVICKALRQGGKFVVITERLVLVVSCSSLVDLGQSDFQGVPANPEWVIEAEIGMDSVIHVTNDEHVVHIVGSNTDTFFTQRQQQQQKQGRGTSGKKWNSSHNPLPLFQTDLEFAQKEEAEDLLQLLLSMIAKGKDKGWCRPYLLHQSNLR